MYHEHRQNTGECFLPSKRVKFHITSLLMAVLCLATCKRAPNCAITAQKHQKFIPGWHDPTLPQTQTPQYNKSLIHTRRHPISGDIRRYPFSA